MPTPNYYSTLTQRFLNYFPYTDVRVRENPITVSAQLLNAVAENVEQQQVKITRELRALNFADMPMNIDNEGVYYATLVPTTFSLPTDAQGNLLPPNVVQGQISGGPLVTLVPYNDLLPVPTRVTLDTTLGSVALPNPELVNTTGNGASMTFNPGPLALPNCLTIQVIGMGAVTANITVSITGELDPPAIWPKDIQTNNEVLIISDDGFYQTDSVWSTVDAIDITGLPVGCQFVCWNLPVNLPSVADPDRPFTHYAYRGVSFPRYWQLYNLRLLEVYQRNRFAGSEVYTSYALPRPVLDLAVEPNTSGILLTDGVNLLYADRRTPMPANLLETGLTVEPAYGINVCYDASQIGDTTHIIVQPMALTLAPTVTQYRYVLEDPAGNVFVVQPDGTFSQYGGNIGWTAGTPSIVTFPLTLYGTYLISLETLGTFNAKTIDTFAYNNSALSILADISLAGLVPGLQGIAFDAYDHLWAYTDGYAVPLVLHYDAFLWDPSTRTIYATDQYQQLQIN